MKLTNKDKAFLVQCCTNCYENKKGEGIHGTIDWTGLLNIKRFNNKEAQGFSADYNHNDYGMIRIIAITGSNEGSIFKGTGDWKFNEEIEQVSRIGKESDLVVPYGNTDSKIRWHKGFITFYINLLRDWVRSVAIDGYNKGMKIWITGHSLGGAETTCAYADLMYMFEDEIKVDHTKFMIGYAASSPRVTNEEGADSFNKRSKGNFYNEFFGNDSVHSTPPRMWMGYVHVEKEKRWSNWWSNIQTPVVRSLQLASIGFLPSLAAWDHDPRKLLAAIKGEPVPFFKDHTAESDKK